MSSQDFISGLAATATPVSRRRLSVEVGILLAVAALQFVGVSYFFSDGSLQKALMMDGTRMTVKLVLFGGGAVAFSALALWSLDPQARRAWPVAVGILAATLLAGVIGFDHSLGSSIGTTLYPEYGVRCLMAIVSFALPVTLVLSILMLRGASTQPNRTALLIGLSGGTWGAFCYAVQCPFVSSAYLTTWYVGGIALVTLAARLILPRIARW